MDGYDAVFLSPHKFVGGPGTPGILLMNKALYRLSSQPPSTCGGGTVAYVNGFSEKVSTPINGDEVHEEFKFILAAIEFIASYGHRFLSLYKFDWITGDWTFRKQAIKYRIMMEELALPTALGLLGGHGESKLADKLEKKYGEYHRFESYLEIIRLSPFQQE
ncbi:hypothetical protein HU200_059547 [Digitaria exilis]|uniref:Aminotransferase class V domain-containing protein n=1 Tax=Digitaria exilis TaxID=1010633 RepID=A0A835DY84_9POAL|nr:hypothetical protein HU200_059547 [Digitaria exilis]